MALKRWLYKGRRPNVIANPHGFSICDVGSTGEPLDKHHCGRVLFSIQFGWTADLPISV